MIGEILIITLIAGVLFLYFNSPQNREISFFDQFRDQSFPAKLLSNEEIEKWKNSGLNGSEAGRAYNNGWIDPTQIVNGKIEFYTNHQQSDENLDPVRVSKFQLDNYYEILHNISQDNNPRMNYSQQINQFSNYYWLPQERNRSNLLFTQNERKWDLIYQNIKNSESVEKVNRETDNIDYLDDNYSSQEKTRGKLIIAQNDQLNSFLNEEQRKVFDLVTSGKNIFFTGSAGTGKSFLLQRIISSLGVFNGEKNIAVTATTGIASVNIGGVTIHSFSGIGGDGDKLSAEDLVQKIIKQRSRDWINNWNKINTLIIDEASMLSGEIFDKLEYIARKVRKNNQPFGGLQVILTGDFFQLPPVKSKKFCFEAEQWEKVLNHKINLVQIYRQKESEFVALLNEIRLGEFSEKSREILKNLEREPNFPNDGIKATLLVSTNNERDTINSYELSKVDGKIYNFRAVDWEDKKYQGRLDALVNSCLALENLELKLGCQVMLIKNLRDSSGNLQLVNGSKGKIVGFRKNFDEKQLFKKFPVVRFENGMEKLIKEEEWKDETPITRIVRARRTQIPLVLGWAISIHKSQGQSIERLKIDLGRVFERGQTYVALSRARSTKYLQVIGFSEGKIICDRKVKKFYQDLSML
ncbi:MAG: AAA family ATPase [Spiroplasmataceae bacterium]|nr:AAA family ATPase [Spiroplasmataceae bacterium]